MTDNNGERQSTNGVDAVVDISRRTAMMALGLGGFGLAAGSSSATRGEPSVAESHATQLENDDDQPRPWERHVDARGHDLRDVGRLDTDHLSVNSWEWIDMVAVGADPTGTEDVVPVMEEVVDDRTLLLFPPGEYRMGTPFAKHGLDGFGIRGLGQPSFTIDGGFEEIDGVHRLFHFGGGGHTEDIDRLYLGGFDIDYTEPGIGYPVFNVAARERLLMEDITVRGPDDSGNTTIMFIPAVRDPHGYGLLRNVNLPDGKDHGIEDIFQGGTTCFVGGGHEGHLRVEDCIMMYGGDNGFRISNASSGDVVIDGGLFGNSDRTAIRIQGSGSHTVKNCHIVVDDHRTGFNIMRGIWISRPDGITDGHVIENVRITMTDVSGGENTTASQYPIMAARGTGDVVFRNIFLHDDRPGAEEYKGPSLIVGGSDDHRITFENLHIEKGPGNDVINVSSENNVFRNVVVSDLNPETGATFDIGADRTRIDGATIDPDEGSINVAAADCAIQGVDEGVPIQHDDAERIRINGLGYNEGDPRGEGEWADHGVDGLQVWDVENEALYIHADGGWRLR